MAALICFPASLSSLSTNTIPKLFTASSLSNTRCFFPHKTPCLSHFVARAYNWGDSEYDDDGDDNGKYTKEDYDSIEIEIAKTGTNSRRIRSKVRIQASLEAVWDILTDYEGLADFIPGVAVSKLLEKTDNFVRLFQIGQQNLAFGLKFDAKGTIDCIEKDLEILPFGKRRDIEFKMVEGDFQLFEGKWSVEQVDIFFHSFSM